MLRMSDGCAMLTETRVWLAETRGCCLLAGKRNAKNESWVLLTESDGYCFQQE